MLLFHLFELAVAMGMFVAVFLAGYCVFECVMTLLIGGPPVPGPPAVTTPNALPGDNPIHDPDNDVLDRKAGAETFAQQVLNLDCSQGAAVGVFGPWGTGKTSFINLTRGTFEQARVPVLDFNPWMFTGADQLVKRFFSELSAELKLRDLTGLGKALEEYGGALSGRAGGFIKLAGVYFRRREGGVHVRRKRVTKCLRNQGRPIVVVLDDVDRLSVPEIREVFKLVRLTASFPNLIYIVLCDRLRVEQALGENGMPGRDYLEKIIQWCFDLPEPPRHLLAPQLDEALETALTGIDDPGPLDEDVWPDVRAEIVRPLVRNMRDVRRYATAVRETVVGLNGKVALADVLGLEAVRVFLPDVFRGLPGAIDGLTMMSQTSEKYFENVVHQDQTDVLPPYYKWHKEQVDRLVKATEEPKDSESARTARDVVLAMFSRLFPVAGRLRQMADGEHGVYANEDPEEYLTTRRVAHVHVLRLYLERVVNPDLLAFHDAERALARMTDRDGLEKFMQSLESAQWQGVMSNLSHLFERFRPEHVQPGVVVFLNLRPDMPEGTGAGFPDDARETVRSTVLQLLQVLDDATAVESAARGILPELASLSSKAELIFQIGEWKKLGKKRVSKTVIGELWRMLRNEIHAVSTDDLAAELDPARVLCFARTNNGKREAQIAIDHSPELDFALLWSVRSETTTGKLGHRAVAQSPRLNWDLLVCAFGSEDLLKLRIENLKEQYKDLKPWLEKRKISLDEAKQLIALAQTYPNDLDPE
ncbi:MAG: P-loop NTPase fold protein [Paracoccaceae bacterium]|nr:P-loop NTPase fold protein [Paracoccaceae bacterium]